MADIQPKNTDTIRVNVIKEKTAATGVTCAYGKEFTSSGMAQTLGSTTAHAVNLKSNNLTRVSLESDGDLAQDATNGGNLLWTKPSTGIAVAAATGLTAAGTIITDALDLTAVFNHVTTAAASTGVQLWDAPIGVEIIVVNSGANALNVWPHDGSGTLNGGAAGSAVSIATNAHAYFWRVSSTDWIAREITSAAA